MTGLLYFARKRSLLIEGQCERVVFAFAVKNGFGAFDFDADQGIQAFFERSFAVLNLIFQGAAEQLKYFLNGLFVFSGKIYRDKFVLKTD